MTVPAERDRAARPTHPRTRSCGCGWCPAGDWKATAGVYDAGARPPARACSRATTGGGREAVRDLPAMRRGRVGAALRRRRGRQRGPRVRPLLHQAGLRRRTSARGVVVVREVAAPSTPAGPRDPLPLPVRPRPDGQHVELWNVPVDDPLLHWLENTAPGEARARRRALRAARRPAGRAGGPHLRRRRRRRARRHRHRAARGTRAAGGSTGGTGGGRPARRTDDAADLALGARELGRPPTSAAPSLVELAGAGRGSHGAPDTLHATGHAFAQRPRTWCPVVVLSASAVRQLDSAGGAPAARAARRTPRSAHHRDPAGVPRVAAERRREEPLDQPGRLVAAVCIRAPMLTTLASLCSRRASPCRRSRPARPARRAPCSPRSASPLPDPPMTTPRLPGSLTTATAARSTYGG